MKIGILYIITGRYTIFWKEFYESCERYLLPDAEKFYFVFTDSPTIEYEKNNKNIYKIFQKNLGWPDNTLKRFHVFLKNQALYKDMDYLYFFNANLKIVKEIRGTDFLPKANNIMTCIHPSFFDKKKKLFPYEHNPLSTAYIPEGEGTYYVAGGLNGGERHVYISMMEELKENIDIDEQNNIVAIWHDESQLNAYIYHHDNYQTLTPSYLYPEGKNLPFEPYIMIRDKNRYGGHEKLRDGSLLDFCINNLANSYIYIYGKGKKGLELQKKLKDFKININGFIISDDEKKNGEDVFYLSQLTTPPEQTKIIVATRLEYQGTIKLLLKRAGYSKNIFLVYKV